MRPSTLILGLSLAANGALLGTLAVRPTLAPPAIRKFFSSRADSMPIAAPPAPDAPPPVAVPPPKMWDLLGTSDPRQLIARLKAAGFSAAAIRLVAFQQVHQRYEGRLRELQEDDPNTPFWKLKGWGSAYSDPQRLSEILRLQREQSRLMNELLGDDLSLSEEMFGDPRRRYGDLPRATLRALESIEEDYNEMEQLLRSRIGEIELPEDREARRLLEREKQADLAALLSPEQLENYLLRNSPTAQFIRNELTLFEASEEEYRTIYRLTATVFDVLHPGGSSWSPTDQPAREAAQQDLREKLKAALGESRFAEYERATNQEFRQLHQLASQNAIPAATIVQAFALRDSAAQESNRILDDSSRSGPEKRGALQALAEATRSRMISLLGPEAGAGYAQLAESWLSGLENGNAVSFANGLPRFRSANRPAVTPNP